MKNLWIHINYFWATHHWTTILIGWDIFYLSIFFFFITLPSLKVGGMSQFGWNVALWAPVTLWSYFSEWQKNVDPDTSEHKIARILKYVIGFIFFGVIMYFGFESQSVLH